MFLLELIGSEGNEGTQLLNLHVSHALSGDAKSETDKVTSALKQRAGREHVIMFGTGMVTTRKCKRIKVDQGI